MDDLKSKIFLLVVVLFVVRLIAGHIYDPTVHRGRWYNVKIPEGWSKEVEDDEVFLKSPEKDYIGNPEAIFSVYGYRSRGALFMDVFFPDVLASLSRQDGKILKTGEVKIDGLVAKWVLFRNKSPEWIIWTFYIIDDFNRLTKIQMMTKPENFDRYRPVFEKFKENFKFKMI